VDVLEKADRDGTRAAVATRALVRARVARARGESPDGIRELVGVVRETGSPWQTLECLRLLVDLGDADAGERAEAEQLAARLGV